MKKMLCAIFLSTLVCACASAKNSPSSSETNFKSTSEAAETAKSEPAAKKSGSACYDIGYKWGVCAAKSSANGSCNPETDVVIPTECTTQDTTQQGIKDGLRDTQMRLQ